MRFNRERVQTIFERALADLKSEAATTLRGGATDFDRLMLDPDIQEVQLVFGESEMQRTRIYDHVKNLRKFYISPRLIDAFAKSWQAHEPLEPLAETIVRLFFLHEFYHCVQGVSSECVGAADDLAQSFRRLDYAADAVSIDMDMRLGGVSEDWKEQLASRCHAAVLGGDAFARLESWSDDGIEGLRIERSLVWWLQYARARSFKPKESLDHFGLHDPVHIEILTTSPRRNLCNSADSVPAGQLREPLELEFDLRLDTDLVRRSYEPRANYAQCLHDALMYCRASAAFELFRPFFARHPELTGRPVVSRTHVEPIPRSLDEERSGQRGRDLPPNNLLDSRDFTFVGRRAELDLVAEHFSRGAREHGNPHVLVHGLGGVGKTSLARAFAYEHARDYPGGIYWVHAETAGSHYTPYDVLFAFLPQLMVKAPDPVREVLERHRNDDVVVRAMAVPAALEQNPLPSLLVLDNVDLDWKSEHLPKGKVHILVTARERRYARARPSAWTC